MGDKVRDRYSSSACLDSEEITELYDVVSNSEERHNLHSKSEYASVLDKLKARMTYLYDNQFYTPTVGFGFVHNDDTAMAEAFLSVGGYVFPWGCDLQ